MKMDYRKYRKGGLERDVKKSIIQYLERMGIFVWVNPRGGARTTTGSFVRFGGPPGASDLFGILPDGRFLAIETKRIDGSYKATGDQRKFLEKVNQSGGIGICAKSIDEVAAVLKPVVGGFL